MSEEAGGGHVVTHRLLEVGNDLPEDELHVLVVGQGNIEAGKLQPVSRRGGLVVTSLLITPLELPSSAGETGN